jgi:hypothetical protein
VKPEFSVLGQHPRESPPHRLVPLDSRKKAQTKAALLADAGLRGLGEGDRERIGTVNKSLGILIRIAGYFSSVNNGRDVLER